MFFSRYLDLLAASVSLSAPVCLFGEYSSPGTTWKYVSAVGSCLEKGNRKRPLTEKGDRRGGEGEKGEVVLEKYIKGEERREALETYYILDVRDFGFCVY